jgi:hypothetical protein
VSILSQKSKENFEAIDILIEHNLKAPVVHCAYYSCLQLLMHFVHRYSSHTEDELKKETQGKGSHNYYISIYYNEIKGLNPKNVHAFYKYFTKFKRKRTEADYYNIEITESDLKRAKDNAIKIHKFLELVENEGRCENIHTF